MNWDVLAIDGDDIFHTHTHHTGIYNTTCKKGNEMSKLLQTYSDDSGPPRYYVLLTPQNRYVRHLYFPTGLSVSQTLDCFTVLLCNHNRLFGLSSISACFSHQNLLMTLWDLFTLDYHSACTAVNGKVYMENKSLRASLKMLDHYQDSEPPFSAAYLKY